MYQPPPRKALAVDTTPVDITPTWFLLAHGGTLGAVIVAEQTAYLYIIGAHQSALGRTIAILWSVFSIIGVPLLIIMVLGTWRQNQRLPPSMRVFSDVGFFIFILLDLLLLAIIITTLVAVTQIVPNA